MQRGLYSAAAGMVIADKWMSTISNNLANASTTAFKRDSLIFQEGMERMMTQPGNSSEKVGGLGAGPAEAGFYTDWSAGQLSPTGNLFDFAIENDQAAFKVITPRGELFSRTGVLALGPNSELVNSGGGVVLDRSGVPIIVPPGELSIAQDGTVAVDGRRIAQIGIYTGEFKKVGDGMFEANDATELDPGQVRIRQGFIETSNVNTVQEMISMIKLNRAFEMAQKSAQSQDESTERLIGILQGR